MEHYLLFDSGCSKCSSLAQTVERESHGWLVARSLHDTAIQEVLNKALPVWRWEPTLLEVEGERVRVFTGLMMHVRLAIGLGPKRALRIAQIVYQNHALYPSKGGKSPTVRRNFLKRASISLGSLALAGTGFSRADTAAYAKEGSPKPSNATIHEITGVEEKNNIQQATADYGVQRLEKYFMEQGYERRFDQAQVLGGSWKDEKGVTHQVMRVTLPFKGEKTLAFIYYVIEDERKNPVSAVSLSDGSRRIDLFLYTIKGEEIIKTKSEKSFRDLYNEVRPSNISTLSSRAQPNACSGGCTLDCIINCVIQLGCNPFVIVGCVTACVTCPENGATCILCYFCLLYCPVGGDVCQGCCGCN